jgi:PAS domain S-box-containing protein
MSCKNRSETPFPRQERERHGQAIGFVEALEESESRLRKVQALAHVGNWRIDLRTRTIWGSEEAIRIYGLDATGQTTDLAAVQALVDPADRPRLDTALARLIAREDEYDVEFRIRRAADGSLRFMQSRAELTLDADGVPVAVDGVVQDVTERKLAEEALKESEKRFRLFFELGLIGMAFTTAEGRIADANKKLCEILGYSKEELVGMSWQQVIHAADLSEIEERLKSIAAGETDGYAVERRLLRKDGQVVHTSVSLRCLRRENGSIESSIELIQDVTERKRIEQEKEKLQGQLRQAQKMESIGRLAGGVAHDFNNLLAPILGYAELLLMDSMSGNGGREELGQIKKAAESARDLTKQLLAFGRKQLLSLATHDLRRIVSDFEPLLRRAIRKEISILVIPPASPLMISVDAGQIERVLMNLAVNAQDAIAGAGTITIEMGGVTLDQDYVDFHPDTTEGPFAVIAVSDTGCGMDAAVQSRLFEPFFTTKGAGKGTGLGLSTAFGIIKQHGGHISAYSEPGKGSTFRVYLPLRHDPSEHLPLLEAVDEEAHRGGQAILVVEDNDAVRNLTVKMLHRLGYKALAAESPQKALALMEKGGEKIDLVLTDIVMPDMNGKEMFLQLTRAHPDLKVLFMSGYTKDLITQSGVVEKGVSFIQKPFSTEVLGRKLRDVLGP